MPRRREVAKRDILPDPKYNSKLVAKFINKVMRRGKKSLAERILYGALDLIEQRSKQDPLDVFHKALDNVRPIIEVKSRRVGGSTYQVPVEVATGSPQCIGHALAHLLCQAKVRENHGPKTCRGVAGCSAKPRSSRQETGRHPSHG